MGAGAKLVGAAGAAAAAALLGAGPAGAGSAQNHRVDETHEFTLPSTTTSCTIRLFTDIWDDGGDGGLGYTSTRILEDQGPGDPCLGDVTMDVRYVEEGGGDEHLVVRGPGGASLEVDDVAEPYPSRSFRVEHTVYFVACDCTVTHTTSPK